MLETQETFTVDAPIDAVWRYASDMRNWGASMPGYQSSEILSDTDSRWTLRLALGPLGRTVRMRVHITEWREPSHVAFTFESENDPVGGQGSFDAEALGPDRTRVTLKLIVRGRGMLAGVMDNLAKPVLPLMARSFAESLSRGIMKEKGSTA
ncbi:MAG: SRPBCC family protein [Thermomicrobiaceae bacterium]|nr:SRPBCC family protein [Thermomicrobiaceae bacterium]